MPSSIGGAMGGGGITIVNNNQIDARGAERGVHRDIERAIRASENRAVERAKVAIHDDRRRSNNSAKVF
jgi:hypothetical protein